MKSLFTLLITNCNFRRVEINPSCSSWTAAAWLHITSASTATRNSSQASNRCQPTKSRRKSKASLDCSAASAEETSLLQLTPNFWPSDCSTKLRFLTTLREWWSTSSKSSAVTTPFTRSKSCSKIFKNPDKWCKSSKIVQTEAPAWSTALNSPLKSWPAVIGHISRFQDAWSRRNCKASKWLSTDFTKPSSRTDRSTTSWALAPWWSRLLTLRRLTNSSSRSTKRPSSVSSTTKTRWLTARSRRDSRSQTKPWRKAWWNFAILKPAWWKNKTLKYQSSYQMKKFAWISSTLLQILDAALFQTRLLCNKLSLARHRLKLMHSTKKSNKKELWLSMPVWFE